MKKRITSSQGFRSVHGALSTIAGYEAMRFGLTPENSPLMLRAIGTQEIYALN